MGVLYLIVFVMVICFGFVIAFGAPYLPTLKPQMLDAIKLADLKLGQHILELGCGDGKILIEAARQGYRVTGYELNPILFLIAKLRSWKYRKQVRVVLGNFWQAQWPEADAIFVFLLPRYMSKLDAAIKSKIDKPIKLVSIAFEIPNSKPVQTSTGVYLYQY
jgi:SAM-dependent methyltransferase